MNNVKLTWPQVGFVAVLGGIVIALATLAHWDATGILGVLGLLAGIGGGGAIVGAVAGRVEAVQQVNEEQTRTLAKIDRQTNGLSEAERQDIANRAAEAAAVRVIRATIDEVRASGSGQV